MAASVDNFVFQQVDGLGETILAARDLFPGEVILCEEPIFFLPMQNRSSTVREKDGGNHSHSNVSLDHSALEKYRCRFECDVQRMVIATGHCSSAARIMLGFLQLVLYEEDGRKKQQEVLTMFAGNTPEAESELYLNLASDVLHYWEQSTKTCPSPQENSADDKDQIIKQQHTSGKIYSAVREEETNIIHVSQLAMLPLILSYNAHGMDDIREEGTNAQHPFKYLALYSKGCKFTHSCCPNSFRFTEHQEHSLWSEKSKDDSESDAHAIHSTKKGNVQKDETCEEKEKNLQGDEAMKKEYNIVKSHLVMKHVVSHPVLTISKGEVLTTSYIGERMAWPLRLRRSFLRTTKSFHCRCARCMAEEEEAQGGPELDEGDGNKTRIHWQRNVQSQLETALAKWSRRGGSLCSEENDDGFVAPVAALAVGRVLFYPLECEELKAMNISEEPPLPIPEGLLLLLNQQSQGGQFPPWMHWSCFVAAEAVVLCESERLAALLRPEEETVDASTNGLNTKHHVDQAKNETTSSLTKEVILSDLFTVQMSSAKGEVRKNTAVKQLLAAVANAACFAWRYYEFWMKKPSFGDCRNHVLVPDVLFFQNMFLTAALIIPGVIATNSIRNGSDFGTDSIYAVSGENKQALVSLRLVLAILMARLHAIGLTLPAAGNPCLTSTTTTLWAIWNESLLWKAQQAFAEIKKGSRTISSQFYSLYWSSVALSGVYLEPQRRQALLAFRVYACLFQGDKTMIKNESAEKERELFLLLFRNIAKNDFQTLSVEFPNWNGLAPMQQRFLLSPSGH